MPKFKFASYKEEILSLYSQGKTFVEISSILFPEQAINNTAQNIRRLVVANTSNYSRKQSYLQQHDSDVKSLLEQGKTPVDISKILNVKYPTISGYIRTNYPEYTFTKNKGNVHYFDTIDSYAKAYIVGFIAADGSLVTKKNCNSTSLTITVKYEDKDVLEFIKSEIGNEHPLLEIKRKSSYDPSKDIHHIRYCITDNNINTALNNLGITDHKSLTMGNIIDNIPRKYRDAFIIGYFDGDGSVSTCDGHIKKNKYFCNNYSLYVCIRGTKEFLSGICKHLNISESHIKQYDSIPSLSFANKRDTARFFKCYTNLPFYFKRKHDKFLTRINHPSYDKYK